MIIEQPGNLSILVGELSAVNGIAGSFAEQVPVAHIVGCRRARRSAPAHACTTPCSTVTHHHFVRMFSEVTTAQVVLGEDPASAIDVVLTTLLTTSRPVHVGVPLDVAKQPVSPERLAALPVPASGDPEAVTAFGAALRWRLSGAAGLTVLVGHGVHRRGLEPDVAAIAEIPGLHHRTAHPESRGPLPGHSRLGLAAHPQCPGRGRRRGPRRRHRRRAAHRPGEGPRPDDSHFIRLRLNRRDAPASSLP